MAFGDVISKIFSGASGGILQGASDIISKFVQDPTQKAQMNEQMQELIVKDREAMAQLAQAQYEAQLKDVQDARDREVKLNESAQTGWLTKNINSLLALSVSLLWGAVTVYLLLRIMNLIESSNKVDMTSLMAFYTAITATETIIISFYFGSSSSSQKKDDTIATIAKS